MTFSLRYFFIDEEGQIHPVALARYERIFSGKEAVPQYAGKKVKVAEVSVELVNGQPTRTVRDSFSLLAIDASGRVDQRFEEDYMRVASEVASDAVFGRLANTKSLGVVQAGGRFAKRRLEQTHLWKPDHKLRKKILDLALDSSSGRRGGGTVSSRSPTKIEKLGQPSSRKPGQPKPIKLTDVPKLFEGRWRITSMPDFDQETIDEEVPAYIEFEKQGGGEFQFIYVHGDIDAQYALLGDRPYIAFSWAGNDECDEAMGRGEALLREDGTISGTFYIHQGDAYAFAAERVKRRSK